MSDKWRFVLTKLDHTPVSGGEIRDAYDRKYIANLSKPSTATFTIRRDNKIMPYLFEDESKLIQVWQNDTLRMWGPIISSNYTYSEGQPPSIAVSAADVGWRMSRRLAGKSEKGTALGPADKIVCAQALITAANADYNTEITYNGADLAGSSGTYTAGPYKQALTCINELAHGLDGFDWYIEPLYGNATYIGVFRAAALVGEEKNVYFEHGVGKRNMRGLGFLRDISTEVNAAYQISDSGLEPSIENPTPVVSKVDTESIAARGRFEEVVELSGVANVTLRQEWVEENVRVRKNPRRVLSMTSDIDDGSGRVPQFGDDYWLGDRVHCRAVAEGVAMFDGVARIYAVEVAINNAGTALVTPILVDEGE